MKYLFVYLLKFYRMLISPLFPPSCRFYPSCSSYAQEAFEKHGTWKGGWLSFRRLSKCHPFHTGGFDPVPPSQIEDL